MKIFDPSLTVHSTLKKKEMGTSRSRKKRDESEAQIKNKRMRFRELFILYFFL
jgi:hypothetical protein